MWPATAVTVAVLLLVSVVLIVLRPEPVPSASQEAATSEPDGGTVPATSASEPADVSAAPTAAIPPEYAYSATVGQVVTRVTTGEVHVRALPDKTSASLGVLTAGTFISEVARLGRTLRAWQQQILAYFHTRG